MQNELREKRKAELGEMIVQILGKNLILNIGQIMNGLNGTSDFRRRYRKEEVVSFNRGMVAIVLGEMADKKKVFKTDGGEFTNVDHHRGLCHVFNGEGRCLCCDEFQTKKDEWKHCPVCEKLNPFFPAAKVS